MSPFLAPVNGTRDGEQEATVKHLLSPLRQVVVQFLSFFPPVKKIYYSSHAKEINDGVNDKSLTKNVGILFLSFVVLFYVFYPSLHPPPFFHVYSFI